MPTFRVTTKVMRNSNGVRIEPGLSVVVVTNYMMNPVLTNGGKEVNDAFMRMYGIDLKKCFALNMGCLDVKRIG